MGPQLGDLVPGPGAVAGRRSETACLSPGQALEWAEKCGNQFVEQEWLARRLREAAGDWEWLGVPLMVIVIREVLGGSATDDEIRAGLRDVPGWLS